MTLKQIVDKCSLQNVREVRRITDGYVELVFSNKRLDDWNRIFSDILGPAKKPAGIKPSKDDLHLTKDYGGIWVNQTLFSKEFDDSTVIAMYWPWQDDAHTTLKMAHVKK